MLCTLDIEELRLAHGAARVGLVGLIDRKTGRVGVVPTGSVQDDVDLVLLDMAHLGVVGRRTRVRQAVGLQVRADVLSREVLDARVDVSVAGEVPRLSAGERSRVDLGLQMAAGCTSSRSSPRPTRGRAGA